jgi:hypothetical protein
MAVIRFRNKEEAIEWKNVIEHFESIVALAIEQSEQLKRSYDAQLQTAQFWKRYALERTNDAKLREIAMNSLKQVELDVRLADSAVPDFLTKMFTLLKQFQPGP